MEEKRKIYSYAIGITGFTLIDVDANTEEEAIEKAIAIIRDEVGGNWHATGEIIIWQDGDWVTIQERLDSPLNDSQ